MGGPPNLGDMKRVQGEVSRGVIIIVKTRIIEPCAMKARIFFSGTGAKNTARVCYGVGGELGRGHAFFGAPEVP